MHLRFEPLRDPDFLARCATLMTQSEPWSALGFTLAQCLTDLAHPAIHVHGAFLGVESTLEGFLASMEFGVGLEPLVEYLCVRHERRGQGIGTALMAFFEDDLYPDVDNLFLFVSDINPGARRLYSRLGYSQVGALPDYDRVGQTEFLFRKTRRPRQA